MAEGRSPSPSGSDTPANAAAYAQIDATFTSLHSLLAAPASSSAHLALLSPPALYSSITHYFSKLRSATLPDFVATVATSRSFWESDCIVFEGQAAGRIHEDVTQLPDVKVAKTSLLSRAYQLHLATARAVLAHIELILTTSNGSTGWKSQRRLRRWVDSINNSVADVPSVSPLMHGVPVARLAILTGLNVGLSVYKLQATSEQKKGKTALNIRSAMTAAQNHWAAALEATLQVLSEIQDDQKEAGAQYSSDEDEEWEREFTAGNADLLTAEQARRSALAREASLVPLLLTAQGVQAVPDRLLSALSPEPLLRLLPLCILALFNAPYLRLSGTAEQVRSPNTHALFPCLGPLSKLLATAGETALLKLRGEDAERLLLASRDAIAGQQPDRASQPGVLLQLVSLAEHLDDQFRTSGFGQPHAQTDPAAKATFTAAWHSLKSFLFVTVQLFDSVLEGLVTTLPSPVSSLQSQEAFEEQWSRQQKRPAGSAGLPVTTTNIQPATLEILRRQVYGLLRLSFITLSITNNSGEGSGDVDQQGGEAGQERQVTSNEIYNRFTTYRHVFYGALEVVKSDCGASTALMQSLLTHLTDDMEQPLGTLYTLEHDWYRRAKLTVFLDVAEQLVQAVPEALIQDEILPICRPYLLDATYAAPYESAHSCVLAIFEAKRGPRLSKDLAPYYVEALLASFPAHISAAQLSHAVSTVVACLSDLDDARSMWVVERLKDEIRAEVARKGKDTEGTIKETSSRDDSATDKAQIVGRRRLDLQLALVDLLPLVNLVLLRSLLENVRGFILEAREAEGIISTATALSPMSNPTRAPAGSDATPSLPEMGIVTDKSLGSGSLGGGSVADDPGVEGEDAAEATPRLMLCSRTFKALNGMDDTARQEGVRWWLENRQDFGV